MNLEQGTASERDLKYRLLFEITPKPMWLLSLGDHKIIDVNEAALKQYGYSREEFLLLDPLKGRPPDERDRFIDDTRERITGMSNRGRWRHWKKDRSELSVEISAFDFEFEGRDVRLVLANDVTEQVQMEEKVKKSYEEIRELASHLQDVREEERAYIAREIHDELGQQLTGLKMDLSWISKRLPPEDRPLRDKMTTAVSLLDNTIRTVRRISTELRPGILDDLGLVPAIEWLAEEFEKRYGTTTVFNTDADKLTFPGPVAVGLFRICQESLTNIARYAEANTVRISLVQQDGSLLLKVIDDGKGFTMATLPGGRKTLGLLSMKERSLMMGGSFRIDSAPGNGTTVTVFIPKTIIG